MKKRSLSFTDNWFLKERDGALPLVQDVASEDGWLPALVPGTVHEALLAAGRIPDPFYGLQEQEVQWIGERDWLYRYAFTLTDDWLATEHLALQFAGLDTYATVWLNGVEIACSENMFVPFQVDIRANARVGENELWIVFASAFERGRALEAEYGKRAIWGEGDSSRVYVRKAQYHYGWDWGPVLLTAGPWREISLLAYEGRIADILCQSEVAADLADASLSITADIELATRPEGITCLVKVYDAQNRDVSETVLAAPVLLENGRYRLQQRIQIAHPQLWWPRGHGAQPLYRVELMLQDAQQEPLDYYETRVGLRRLELIQHPLADQPGTSFYFEINHTPIFCGGANWIPADALTPRITPARYRQWVQMAADANITMLRVWGGGIYEDDAFYEACDTLGILVWQDFMFACGMYPGLDWMQTSARAEAEAAVRRLHTHPSIALWCGNNEDYILAWSIKQYDAEFTGDLTSIAFSGRQLYEQVLPEVCARLDPTRPYWRGSPYGGSSANNPEVGDQHVWDVWHGSMRKYQDYPQLSGRFVSEFGMQAMPVRPTVDAFTVPDERYPLSRTLEHHNKATDGSRRLAVYLADNVRNASDLDSYIYATQFIQSEALCAALRGWRRQWQGAGKEYVGGALIWQINDCWPVTSWAIVDYYLRPKPAYYSARRELAPVVVGLAAQDNQQAAVWAVNDTSETLAVRLSFQWWSLDGTLLNEEQASYTLAPHQASELDAVAYNATRGTVLSVRLYQREQVSARATLWPEPFKYITLPDPDITLERVGADTLSLRTQRPAKGVWLTSDTEPVKWSDNMFDLLPGETYQITGEGLAASSLVSINWLRA